MGWQLAWWVRGLAAGLVGALPPVPPGAPPKESERSEARPPLGTTKEVLVIIDFLVFNYDFLGFPSICIRIYYYFLGFPIRILS